MKNVSLADYHYELPTEKIAKYPLNDRGKSKLLKYQVGAISHHTFEDIPGFIDTESLLVFNNTRVIPARIHFYKKTGAKIEVFLLEPVTPSTVEEAMNADQYCEWKCMIGNAKKWSENQPELIESESLSVTITRLADQNVSIRWNDKTPFSTLIQQLGKMPLPPYIKRQVEKEDEDRYQTVYAEPEGAVAAPTAGLHFTNKIIEELESRGVTKDFVTLHVSAGTFQPIKADDISEHPMHQEEIIISRKNIEKLIAHSHVVAVGTTSLRTLESLYWFGASLENNPEAPFIVEKMQPYNGECTLSKQAALKNVMALMERNNLQQLIGHTEIFIFPGYQFRVINALITNFHLPGSTLILLIASFIGDDWRKVYKEALTNDYRFLSYGDSSLLIP